MTKREEDICERRGSNAVEKHCEKERYSTGMFYFWKRPCRRCPLPPFDEFLCIPKHNIRSPFEKVGSSGYLLACLWGDRVLHFKRGCQL
ncbi:hypothetical protein CDAR_391211 [Caerostris darwini]|uniref:Uncharacterized protein n=1 Tax=Caerostris darwini TaxID=1538125 RepID=A0AAV4SVM8_9ARAC|nr:hypothetical protein CDAR_391211 [Caerostris darwini]